MEYKDKLYLLPTVVARILLYLSFILYAWQMTGMVINSVPYISGNSVMEYKTAFIICQLVSAGVNLIVFELVGSFYYGFIRPICPPVGLTKDGFMVYLRIGYILRNIIAGVIKLLFIKTDLHLFAFDSLINLGCTVLVLSLILVYVMAKYVPTVAKPAFLKCSCLPFLVYEAIVIGVSLI